MRTFSELRTITSGVVMEVASRWGGLIWTPTKISPANEAATPDARKRVVCVMVMSFSLSEWVCTCRDANRGYIEQVGSTVQRLHFATINHLPRASELT